MHLWKIQIPPPPCPHKLKKKVGDGKFPKFINMIRHLSVNIPYVEALEKMPGYAKFMKEIKERCVLIYVTMLLTTILLTLDL